MAVQYRRTQRAKLLTDATLLSASWIVAVVLTSAVAFNVGASKWSDDLAWLNWCAAKQRKIDPVTPYYGECNPRPTLEDYALPVGAAGLWTFLATVGLGGARNWIHYQLDEQFERGAARRFQAIKASQDRPTEGRASDAEDRGQAGPGHEPPPG